MPDYTFGDRLKHAWNAFTSRSPTHLNDGMKMVHRSTEASTTEHTFGTEDLNLFNKYKLKTLRGVEPACGYQVSRVDLSSTPAVSVFKLDEYTSRSETIRSRLIEDGFGYKWWRRE